MCAEEVSVAKNKKYELVAPDGGWGYMIFIAFIINISTTMSFVGCFGMLFNDFMVEIGMESTGVTFLTGITAMCYAMAGFLANPLLKLMSKRKLALLASVTFNVGSFGIAFVNSKVLFFICQGILQGTGLGVLYNLTNTVLNEYFVKKRMFAFSFVQTIVAVTSMGAPMFVKWSLEEYGYRGTLILLSAISIQNFVGVTLMQPVEGHMKRLEIPTETTHEMQPLLLQKNTEESNIMPIVKLTDVEAVVVSASVEKIPEDSSLNVKKSELRKFFEAFVDVSLCKTFLLSCACFGSALCMFADATFSLILPQALYSMDWDQDMVAWALSLIAFGDLAMRVLLIFASNWLLKIGSQEIYIMGIILGFVSRLGLLWSQNTIAVLTFIILIGAARCFIVVMVVVVISDVVSTDKFTIAMGMFMMLFGLIVLILGPAVGAIRDATNSFTVAFNILTAILAVVSLVWIIELCYKKNKAKKILRSENSKISRCTNK